LGECAGVVRKERRCSAIRYAPDGRRPHTAMRQTSPGAGHSGRKHRDQVSGRGLVRFSRAMPEGYPLTFEHWLGAGDLAPA